MLRCRRALFCRESTCHVPVALLRAQELSALAAVRAQAGPLGGAREGTPGSGLQPAGPSRAGSGCLPPRSGFAAGSGPGSPEPGPQPAGLSRAGSDSLPPRSRLAAGSGPGSGDPGLQLASFARASSGCLPPRSGLTAGSGLGSRAGGGCMEADGACRQAAGADAGGREGRAGEGGAGGEPLRGIDEELGLGLGLGARPLGAGGTAGRSTATGELPRSAAEGLGSGSGAPLGLPGGSAGMGAANGVLPRNAAQGSNPGSGVPPTGLPALATGSAAESAARASAEGHDVWVGSGAAAVLAAAPALARDPANQGRGWGGQDQG